MCCWGGHCARGVPLTKTERDCSPALQSAQAPLGSDDTGTLVRPGSWSAGSVAGDEAVGVLAPQAPATWIVDCLLRSRFARHGRELRETIERLSGLNASTVTMNLKQEMKEKERQDPPPKKKKAPYVSISFCPPSSQGQWQREIMILAGVLGCRSNCFPHPIGYAVCDGKHRPIEVISVAASTIVLRTA